MRVIIIFIRVNKYTTRRPLIFFLSFFALQCSYAQKDPATLVKEIVLFQENLNKEYKDAKTSALSKKEREAFKQINFFPMNLEYVVTAEFIRASNEKIFGMTTSGNTKKRDCD